MPDLDARIAELYARGVRPPAIAATLGISLGTVTGRAWRMGLAKPKGVRNKLRPLQLAPPARLDRGCRFIAGDPIPLLRAGENPFCGAPLCEGSSYCAAHHRVCTNRRSAVSLSPSAAAA
jgi:hypothetical protein